jgi:hypothetical protein
VTLNATVDPEDQSGTTAYFCWGPSSVSGLPYCTAAEPVSGGAQSFSQTLTGLSSTTGYHYVAFASGPGGFGIGADATFTTNAPQYTLSVSFAGSGSGTVTGQGISCPGTCQASYTQGTAVTLPATPAAGSTFTGWSGGGCSGTGTCVVTMSQDQAVTATFTASSSTHTLGVSLAGTGSGSVTSSPAGISCPGTCSHSYTSGTQVTLTATPASGSTFAGWSGGGCSGTGTCTVTMNSDQGVYAVFARSGGPQPAVLSLLRAAPKTFVLAGRRVKGQCVKQTGKNRTQQRCTLPIKRTVSYQLNTAASVTITITRLLPGRTVNGRCVKQTRKNREHKSCKRLVAVHGDLTETGVQGENSFVFNGRIGGHRLGAGSYLLTATPAANGKAGTPQTAAFKIAS